MTHHHGALLLFILLFLFGARPVVSYAQSALPLDRFEGEDGLSHDWILAIAQDNQGFLWIGTSDGLNRYDGYEFVVYQHQPGDTTSLRQNLISDLVLDANGDLWVAAGGLHRLDRSTGHLLRYDLGLDPYIDILQMAADGHGNLWIAAETGVLYRYDILRDTLVGYGLSSPGAALEPAVAEVSFTWGDRPLTVDVEGTLWVSTTHQETVQLHRYEAASARFQSMSLPSDLGVVHALHASASGRVWIGGQRLGWVDPQTQRFAPMDDWPTGRIVRSLHEDQSGVLWVGTDNGLYRHTLTSQTWEHHILDTSGSAALGNFCRVFYEDNAGALWIGTHGRLYRYDPHRKSFAHLGPQNGLPDTPGGSMVMALEEEMPGRLWVGTLGSGLLHVDQATSRVTTYRHRAGDAQSLPDDEVWALHQDRHGRLWVGTRNGLATRDPRTGRFTRYPLPRHTANAFIYAITEDPNGRLWITGVEDLYQIDPADGQLLTHIDIAEKLPDRISLNLQETIFTPPGTLWIGSLGAGLLRYDLATESLTEYSSDAARQEDRLDLQVYDLYVDAAGIIWLGTDTGLVRFDPQTEHFITPYQQPPTRGSLVFSLLEDEQHRFWLGTNGGLVRFDPQTEQVHPFDAIDGTGSTEFNRRAVLRSRDGLVHFGGIKGITSFHPSRIQENPFIPPVALTRIHVSNRDTTVTLVPDAFAQQPLVLSYRDYAFAFEFAALNFTNPQKNQYAYRLEGFEAHWTEPETRRRADYTNIPPGDYVFRVRGSNDDGRWNREGAALRLTITPPWWKTNTAYLSYVLLVLGLLYGVIKSRSLRLERRNRELTQRVAERTAEIERQRAKIEAQARKLMELDAMKSRFFANISHEFRTPLTLIRGPLEDLRIGRHGALSASMQDQVNLSLRNAERLRHLIDQLLALSRLEAGKLKLRAAPGEWVGFARRVTSAFASLGERRQITLTFEADTPEIVLYFDPAQFEQILNNLLSNAFKFTPEGGRIAIVVEDDPGEADERGVGRFATLRISDTGIGIPDDALPHLFDRFYQVDASSTRLQEGSGIGLALVKELVALHGGAITVTSEVGVGTTFAIRLPKGTAHLAEEEIAWEREREGKGERERGREGEREKIETAEALEADPTVSPTDAPASDGFRILGVPKILIVEDNEDLRAYVCSHLTPRYTVVEAADGAAGLEQARMHKPDLIISDVMMPKMDGLALLTALREDTTLKTIPVILLTARATEADRLEGLTARADDYLTKPFNPEELTTRVRNLIELRQSMRAQYSRQMVLVDPGTLNLDSADQAFLAQAQTLVEAHFDDHTFTVQVLAEGLYMSKSKLERRLKAVTGQTPAAFIRQMRLQRAHALLTQQAVETVAEAAFAVGFNSVEYFSRLYQRAFEQRPSEHLS